AREWAAALSLWAATLVLSATSGVCADASVRTSAVFLLSRPVSMRWIRSSWPISVWPSVWADGLRPTRRPWPTPGYSPSAVHTGDTMSAATPMFSNIRVAVTLMFADQGMAAPEDYPLPVVFEERGTELIDWPRVEDFLAGLDNDTLQVFCVGDQNDQQKIA